MARSKMRNDYLVVVVNPLTGEPDSIKVAALTETDAKRVCVEGLAHSFEYVNREIVILSVFPVVHI